MIMTPGIHELPLSPKAKQRVLVLVQQDGEMAIIRSYKTDAERRDVEREMFRVWYMLDPVIGRGGGRKLRPRKLKPCKRRRAAA